MNNSIFIVIDAMRNYTSDQDERGRQKVIDKLQHKNFSLINGLCVSAPSSVMSAITMITGKPAYNQYPNYMKIDFKKTIHKTITKSLNQNGVNIYGIFYYREMRELLRSQYPNIKNEYLITSSANIEERWSNEFIYKQVNHLIKYNLLKEPFHLMLWFNSRDDYKTSYYVEKTINCLEKTKNWDKSLVLVTGDHGYPDMRRGFTSDGADLKKVGLRHDLIMTDDNLIVPLAIKYGNIKLKSFIEKGIYKQELIHNIIESFYRKKTDQNLEKVFKKNHINSKNLFIGDSRFFLQKNRATTVRSDTRKIIIYPDNSCELYDLKNDPLEEKSVKTNLDNIDQNYLDLYKFFDESEKKDFKFWSSKYRNLIKSKLKNSNKINKYLKENHKLIIRVIGSKIFKILLEQELTQNLKCGCKKKTNKLIVIDDIRLRSSFLEVNNHFKKGDIILDSELNLIGGKFMLIFNYYKIKYHEAWKRYLYRIAIQPNIYLKFKEFINTIIFLSTKK